jgi:hypothetical protein
MTTTGTTFITCSKCRAKMRATAYNCGSCFTRNTNPAKQAFDTAFERELDRIYGA